MDSTAKTPKALKTAHPNPRKFTTTALQHEKGFVAWHIKNPRRAAADPKVLEEWMQRNGPYMYHVTEPAAAEKILEDGLHPWDSETNTSGTRFDVANKEGPGEDQSFLEPRPDHVYLAEKHKIPAIQSEFIRDWDGYSQPEERAATLRIDLRKLDPQNINPDEDSFGFVEHAPEGYPSPYQHHHFNEPTMWGINSPDPVGYREWPSLGQWAEEQDLGSNPFDVKHSLDKLGTISHRGPIHPDAIEKVSNATFEPEPALESVGHVNQYNQSVADTEAHSGLEGVQREVRGYQGSDAIDKEDDYPECGNELAEFRHAANIAQMPLGWPWQPGATVQSIFTGRSGTIRDVDPEGMRAYVQWTPSSGGWSNATGLTLQAFKQVEQPATETGWSFQPARTLYTQGNLLNLFSNDAGRLALEDKDQDAERDSRGTNQTTEGAKHQSDEFVIARGYVGDGQANAKHAEEKEPDEEHGWSIASLPNEMQPPPERVDLDDPDARSNGWDIDSGLHGNHYMAASADEIHIGFDLHDETAKKIREWVDSVDWPKGTELEPIENYHITVVYTGEGREQYKALAERLANHDGFTVTIVGLDEFPSSEGKDKASVLRLGHCEALLEHIEKVYEEFEDAGLEPTRFPGGHKPHITVAFGSGGVKETPPELTFDTKPSSVSTPRVSSLPKGNYDELGNYDDSPQDAYRYAHTTQDKRSPDGQGRDASDSQQGEDNASSSWAHLVTIQGVNSPTKQARDNDRSKPHGAGQPETAARNGNGKEATKESKIEDAHDGSGEKLAHLDQLFGDLKAEIGRNDRADESLFEEANDPKRADEEDAAYNSPQSKLNEPEHQDEWEYKVAHLGLEGKELSVDDWIAPRAIREGDMRSNDQALLVSEDDDDLIAPFVLANGGNDFALGVGNDLGKHRASLSQKVGSEARSDSREIDGNPLVSMLVAASLKQDAQDQAPDEHDEQDGQHDMHARSLADRTAALTTAQRLRQQAELEQELGPDQTKVVHQFPDGWKVHKIENYADMEREGRMMGNCFGLYSSDMPHTIWGSHPECEWASEWEDPEGGWIERPPAIENWNVSLPVSQTKPDKHVDENGMYVGPFYSLRDPHGLPHASIDAGATDPALGMHNSLLKQEYLDRLEQWGNDPQARQSRTAAQRQGKHNLVASDAWGDTYERVWIDSAETVAEDMADRPKDLFPLSEAPSKSHIQARTYGDGHPPSPYLKELINLSCYAPSSLGEKPEFPQANLTDSHQFIPIQARQVASRMLRTTDSWDTRQWPDGLPTPPATGPGPEPKGCTCQEEDKLNCPVHGMHATEQDYDHTWFIPQVNPVGYPQDQPRNWTQASVKKLADNACDDDERKQCNHAHSIPRQRHSTQHSASLAFTVLPSVIAMRAPLLLGKVAHRNPRFSDFIWDEHKDERNSGAYPHGYFHEAPTSERGRIQQWGLQPGRPTNNGKDFVINNGKVEHHPRDDIELDHAEDYGLTREQAEWYASPLNEDERRAIYEASGGQVRFPRRRSAYEPTEIHPLRSPEELTKLLAEYEGMLSERVTLQVRWALQTAIRDMRKELDEHRLGSRISGLTDNQKLKAIQQTEQWYPDTSERVHEFPDGWGIHKLVNPADRIREGELLHNCWRNHIPEEHRNESLDDFQRSQFGRVQHQWMTLRDPGGYPHAAFFLSDPDDPSINQVAGHGNAPIKQEHWDKIADWGLQNNFRPGRDIKVDQELKPVDEEWMNRFLGSHIDGTGPEDSWHLVKVSPKLAAEPDGGWGAWGGEPDWDEPSPPCPSCKSPNTGLKIVKSGPSQWTQIECGDCLGRWTYRPEKQETPEHPDPWMDNEPGTLTIPHEWNFLASEELPYRYEQLPPNLTPAATPIKAWKTCNNCGKTYARDYHTECPECRTPNAEYQQLMPEPHPDPMMDNEPGTLTIPQEWSFLAGETLPQQKRRWESLKPHPRSGRSEVVHQWPDGWTVQEHPTTFAIQSVGQMMNNCWQGKGPKSGRHFLAIHDENDIPRVAFYQYQGHPNDLAFGKAEKVGLPYGQRNKRITPEEETRLREFATVKGFGVGHIPEDDMLPLPAQIGEPEALGAQARVSAGLPSTAPYYHKAPTEDRARILQHGLQPSSPRWSPHWYDDGEEPTGQAFQSQPTGVYLAKRPQDTMGAPKGDIWQVDPSYVQDWVRDRIVGGPVVTHPIPPEALKLHTPYEQYSTEHYEHEKELEERKRNLYWPEYQEEIPDYHQGPGGSYWKFPPEWGIGKVAGMTVPQQQRFKAELEKTWGPEKTQVIHQFPDGWSIHHLPTWNEVGREGQMMNHCWGGLAEPGKEHEPVEQGQESKSLSLRDPNGWPHASFWFDPMDYRPYEIGIHGGQMLDYEDPANYQGHEAEHMQHIQDFANAHRTSKVAMPSIQPGMYDPLRCPSCASAMTEPKQWADGNYYNSCPKCGGARRIPANHPLLKTWLQNDPPYPQELMEVGPDRSWSVNFAKVAMPIEPDFWQQWSEPESEYHPRGGQNYLYHGTHHDFVPSIMEHGLLPWDYPQGGGTNYENEPSLEPRPGHTYLSQNASEANHLGASLYPFGVTPTPVLLRINPAFLQPHNISPDEDYQEELNRDRFHSWGEQAEAEGWGDDPQQTRKHFQDLGHDHIAYRGAIPPEAIEAGHLIRGEWQPDHSMWTTAKTASVRNTRKFETTAKDHEAGKRKWGLPKSHSDRKILFFHKPRKKGAADPQWLQRWIEANGPYMTHVTRSKANRDKILQEGLIPHDTVGVGSVYNGTLVPRPNHSYIGYNKGALVPVPPALGNRDYIDPITVAVDLRKLDPERLNPDEDSLDRGQSKLTGFPSDLPEATEAGSCVEDENGKRYPTWGTFANSVGAFRPHHTAWSMNHLGTMAVEGGVSPEAIMPIDAARQDMAANFPHILSPYREMGKGYTQVPFEQPQEEQKAAKTAATHPNWKTGLPCDCDFSECPEPPVEPTQTQPRLDDNDNRSLQIGNDWTGFPG